MCQLFIGADPDLYRSRSRSLRLHGVATSIRLENLFWNILEEIGARDDMSVGRLLTRLYDELAAAGGDCANFTSFLRVSCGRYLALQVAGSIPADRSIPIRSLDAALILAREASGREHAPHAKPVMSSRSRSPATA